MLKQRVATKNHDINGCRIGRVLKQNVLCRLIPIGNFGGGTSLKVLAGLWGLHTFSRVLWALKMRFENFGLRSFFRNSPGSKRPGNSALTLAPKPVSWRKGRSRPSV